MTEGNPPVGQSDKDVVNGRRQCWREVTNLSDKPPQCFFFYPLRTVLLLNDAKTILQPSTVMR